MTARQTGTMHPMPAQATPTATARRPKHDPQVSEREILGAAERLVRERPLREVTVAGIMARTGLKRPAFWTHFRDINDVLIRIADRLAGELIAASDQWLGDGSRSEADLAQAMRQATHVYAEHVSVVRALADAAPADARADAAYTGMIERLIDAVEAKIRSEQSAGSVAADLDARETARALLWMNERYLYQAMRRGDHPDVDAMAALLTRIWCAALYD